MLRATEWDGNVHDDPSDEQIFDLLSHLNLTYRFLILEKSDQHYIQVYLHDDLSTDVEHRDGGPDAHFRAHVTTPYDQGGHEQIAAVFRQWAADDDSWRHALPWEPLDLSQ